MNRDSSFLELPRLIPDPSSTAIYSEKNRLFTGIPSLCISPQGRLWATWYAGPTAAEDHNNYVVISTSADTGRTWKEVLVIDPDGPGPVRAITLSNPEETESSWPEPRRLTDGIMMCKPTVLSSGEWVLPRLNAGSCGRTYRCGVGIVKLNSLGCQFIDIWGLIKRVAISRQISSTQIIGHNQDNIGTVLRHAYA